jgi:non-specific serine/threonine protein kinase
MRGHVIGGLSAGVPVLDTEVKAACKCRLNELRQDLNKAERFNDSQRKTEVQNEMQAIADYLAAAVGLGGRDRKTSSDAERARCAVTKCIKKAIKKIGVAIPALGYHLAARIKTGYFCSYNPHPERPVNWKF